MARSGVPGILEFLASFDIQPLRLSFHRNKAVCSHGNHFVTVWCSQPHKIRCKMVRNYSSGRLTV